MSKVRRGSGCSINIVFFKSVILLNSASSAAAKVFYLPGVCTHTDTEGKQRRVRNILKSSGKNPIFPEHPVEDDNNTKMVCGHFHEPASVTWNGTLILKL